MKVSLSNVVLYILMGIVAICGTIVGVESLPAHDESPESIAQGWQWIQGATFTGIAAIICIAIIAKRAK